LGSNTGLSDPQQNEGLLKMNSILGGIASFSDQSNEIEVDSVLGGLLLQSDNNNQKNKKSPYDGW
tara:strand:+ start:616 stop:810 length:195 start_codon:yes stop_codon:yes gene_type:complete